MVPKTHRTFHISLLPPTESRAAWLFLVLFVALRPQPAPLEWRGAVGHLTFPLHAHDQALLVATVLAAVALALVDETIFVIPTGVDEIFPDGPFEEAFAAFTAVYTVVLSWLRENNPKTVPIFT